jgi:hypothetical protein
MSASNNKSSFHFSVHFHIQVTDAPGTDMVFVKIKITLEKLFF